nr:probable serine/threonine-protein kinase clkA [Ipomoea batatas]
MTTGGSWTRERHYYCQKCGKDHPGIDCQGNIVACLNCGKRGHRAFECCAGKNVTSSSLRQHGSMGQPSVNQSKLRVNGVRDSNNNGGNIARLNNQDETQQSKIYVMSRTQAGTSNVITASASDRLVVRASAPDRLVVRASAPERSVEAFASASSLGGSHPSESWSPPPIGMVKCNVDAALHHGYVSFGAVLRNHEGGFVVACNDHLVCPRDPYLAESMVVKESSYMA